MAIDNVAYGCPNDGDVGERIKREARELALELGRVCDDMDDEFADALCAGCRELIALSGLAHALAVALALRCEGRDNPPALVDAILDAIRVDALTKIRADQARPLDAAPPGKKETRH